MTSTEEKTSLSNQYETPLGLSHSSVQALKDRIKLHYDLASDHYLNLWGEHIHHGYWPTEASRTSESKEIAQLNLVKLLINIAYLSKDINVLDVGCGIGGTSRYLALEYGCTVTGITLSSKQVEIANRLTLFEAQKQAEENSDRQKPVGLDSDGFVRLGRGKVQFIELDAENMAEYFHEQQAGFDAVWISEALSHFSNKALFFRNAHNVLRPHGKLVIADWFKAEGLDEQTFTDDIKPIEDGMLLPPLCTKDDYIRLAKDANLQVFAEPKDISQEVRQTWDITWSLIQNPSLWAFALTQGRDGIAFLQSFRAMRRGYANGSFRYAVMVCRK